MLNFWWLDHHQECFQNWNSPNSVVLNLVLLWGIWKLLLLVERNDTQRKVVIWFFKFLTTKGAGSIDFQWMTGRFSRQIEDYLPNNWELDGARLVYHWNEITQGQINNLRWVAPDLPSLFLMTLLTRSKISSFFASPKMWTIFASLVVMMCQWTFLLQLF